MVELEKGLVKIPAVLKLQSARVSAVSLLQIVPGWNAIDAAGHAIATGNDWGVGELVAAGESGQGRQRSEKADCKGEFQTRHSNDFNLLATLLPRAPDTAVGAAHGTVLTTATGSRSLPDTIDRIVVGA